MNRKEKNNSEIQSVFVNVIYLELPFCFLVYVSRKICVYIMKQLFQWFVVTLFLDSIVFYVKILVISDQ